MENNKSDNYRVPQNEIDAQQLEDSLKKPDLSDQKKGAIYCRLGLFYFFNKDAKNHESAYKFFKQSMEKGDLLGSAYLFLYDSFKDEELDNNLTNFLNTKDLSVDQLLTLSQTNAYAAYLLGRIYEEGLFNQDKKVDNNKAIEYFRKSLENPILEIPSKYHLALVYKDENINKGLSFDYLKEISEKDNTLELLSLWTSSIKRLETNIFQINEKFSKILAATKEEHLKKPLANIIEIINNTRDTVITPKNITDLKEEIENFLKLMDKDKTYLPYSLKKCRELFISSLQSCRSDKKYLLSRMHFLRIKLEQIGKYLIHNPDNLNRFVKDIKKRLSVSLGEEEPALLAIASQSTSHILIKGVCFGFFKQWALYKSAKLSIPKENNLLIHTITQDIFEYQEQQGSNFFQKEYFSQSVNFGLKESRRRALDSVIKILEKNKEQVFHLSIKTRNSGHSLGIYMYQDGKIEYTDANTGTLLFKDSKQFINYLLKKNSMVYRKGRGRIYLYKFNNFKLLKRRTLLLSLIIILDSIAIFYSVTKLNNLYCRPLKLLILLIAIPIILIVTFIISAHFLIHIVPCLAKSYKKRQLINKLKEDKTWKNIYKVEPAKSSVIEHNSETQRELIEAEDSGKREEKVRTSIKKR